jgi:probable 2-oxoglutarate dehydrogenase E1 component DHKTD1
VDACLKVAKLATQYRCKWGKDVYIDLIGFRKHGHNEVDEPAFTQPAMYNAIRSRDSIATTYAQKLVEEGVETPERLEKLRTRLETHLQSEYEASTKFSAEEGSAPLDFWAFQGKWEGLRQAEESDLGEEGNAAWPTGVDSETLLSWGEASVAVPDGFEPHSRLRRTHIGARLKALEKAKAGEASIDWATAEAMAHASVLAQGGSVRLTGQDCQRGTFSHRHAVLTDQNTGSRYAPLTTISPDFHVYSSHLSEFAVMGFEYGYSLETPKVLPMWEAQFGDFGNSAQIMIDNFVTSGESKWLRQSALTLLLPHGFDGAGPEHSSARLERFLQLVNSHDLMSIEYAPEAPDKACAEPLNFSIVSPSTPANYFHALTRQVARPFRKPLVVSGPKGMLRMAACTSTLEDMGPGTHFQTVLTDPLDDARPDSDVQRVVLCTGKMYYTLAEHRAALPEAEAARVALVRVEELAPLPTTAIQAAASKYPGAELMWAQEEPVNAGAAWWVDAHLRTTAKRQGVAPPELRVAARLFLAAVVVGVGSHNTAQGVGVLNAVFGGL